MKMSESDKRKLDRFVRVLFVCSVGGGMLNIVYAQFILDVSIWENPITNTVLLFILIGMQHEHNSSHEKE